MVSSATKKLSKTGFGMEIRDAIHGLVGYNTLEESVLNTHVLQRMRRIKQLALAELVYPSAGHSRFEHVVGVMHLAGRMADKFDMSGENKQIVRLAALLHDIGHAPFSHTSELVLRKFTDPATLQEVKRKSNIETIHEAITVDILRFDEELHQCMRPAMREHVISLIQPGPGSLPKQIVSGPLDADKLDYIIRDAHQAGVSYGVFDLHKVLESFEPVRVSTSEEYIGVKEAGVWAIEQLLLAKYHMNAQVYRHKIRRITDAMLVRGLMLAVEEGIRDLRRLYTYQATKEYCRFFLTFDDDTLMGKILEESKSMARDIFLRLRQRNLIKEIFRKKIDTLNFSDALKMKKLKDLGQPQAKAIETEIAELMGARSELLVLDKQSLTNPTFKYPEREIDPETILVLMDNENKTKRIFSEVSNIFANPAVGPRDEFLYVYAPLDELSHDERKRRIAKLRDPISKIIDRHLD